MRLAAEATRRRGDHADKRAQRCGVTRLLSIERPASARRRLSPRIQRHAAAASPDACAVCSKNAAVDAVRAIAAASSSPSPYADVRRACRHPAVPAAGPGGGRASQASAPAAAGRVRKSTVILRVFLRPHDDRAPPASSHNRVSTSTRSPASRTCAWRAISNSRARCRARNEFRFLIFRRAPSPPRRAGAATRSRRSGVRLPPCSRRRANRHERRLRRCANSAASAAEVRSGSVRSHERYATPVEVEIRRGGGICEPLMKRLARVLLEVHADQPHVHVRPADRHDNAPPVARGRSCWVIW